jgi:hypothetical protein
MTKENPKQAPDDAIKPVPPVPPMHKDNIWNIWIVEIKQKEDC